MREESTGVSRRDFLKGASLSAMGVAAAGALVGCTPSSSSAEEVTTTESTSSWKTSPAEATQFSQEYDCDAVVVGHGYAGLTACREIAEEGKSVILIDKQTEENYAAVGNEAGILNATILKQRGVPTIDPVEFYQNFMTIAGNYPNPKLVMKYAQNSGANMDWYLSECTADDLATMTTAFFPPTANQMDHIGVIKFWASVCSFYGDCNQTKLHEYNRAAAEKAGAEFQFAMEAQYVIMKDGAVAGLVATDVDGNYVKYNSKAVVCACGGFGGNTEMMTDLMPDIAGALVEGESLSSMSSNTGRGVQMAYWAGAALESQPVPGMNMKGFSIPGKMNCLPQALWLDENGERYCNEFYPTSEQRGISTVYGTRKTKYAVLDSNFPTYRTYMVPQHAGFTASDENIASLQASLDTAYQKFKGTYVEAATTDATASTGPVTSIDFIADDTLEGLAGQLGLTGEAATNFVASVERYSQMCAQGIDEDFGRDPAVLFPVNQAPYYACTCEPDVGETMVTLGGIITDGNQNAVDKDHEPIPGLYVSGNDCGRRFGIEYITPIPGISLGFAITLGRECGKSVGEFLS